MIWYLTVQWNIIEFATAEPMGTVTVPKKTFSLQLGSFITEIGGGGNMPVDVRFLCIPLNREELEKGDFL